MEILRAYDDEAGDVSRETSELIGLPINEFRQRLIERFAFDVFSPIEESEVPFWSTRPRVVLVKVEGGKVERFTPSVPNKLP